MIGPGFEVELASSGVTDLVVHAPPNAADGQVQVSFAKDPASGSGLVLLGDLHYLEDLATTYLGWGSLRAPALASDAAIALEMYRRHGAQGLRELEGDFSLVLFDGMQSILILCR